MIAKDLKFSTAARNCILSGVDQIADAVKVTLGPKGRNVIIQQEAGYPRITKDGVSVARTIHLLDKFENMGASMLRLVASQTCENVGDGTTTAAVLAQAIMREGSKLVAAGFNPMDLKRGIDAAVEHVVGSIQGLSRPVESEEEVAHVGTISSNGDVEIGKLLASILYRIGIDGVITVEESAGVGISVNVADGLRFDRGYLSPSLVTNPNRMVCELANPAIIMYDGKINVITPLIRIVEALMKEGRNLLIMADEIEGEALKTIVLNKMRGIMQVCAVRLPSYGVEREDFVSDIEALTGGRMVRSSNGEHLSNVQLKSLGNADRIIISRDSTTIVGSPLFRDNVQDRIQQITDQISAAEGEHKEALRVRRARLAGGVASVEVGGTTELDVKEKKDRVEDALYATRSAMEEGIVPGGGVTLLRAKAKLCDLRGANADQDAGIRIVMNALEAPARQILENAGDDSSVIIGRIQESDTPSFGYDAQNGTYCDLIESGIVDPAKVTRTALQDAAAVAGLLLTTEVMVADIDPIDLGLVPGHRVHERGFRVPA